MTDAAWKAFERRIADVFGGQRRGAYTGNGRQGKSDIIVPGWGVECKLLSRPNFQQLLDAARQAESNRECPADIPVAVVKRKGDHDTNALVVMRLEQFQEYFINERKDGENGSRLE